MDWKAVHEFGISFALIRLGYGQGHLDGMFYRNVNGALAVGLDIGVYYYSYALTPEAVQQEAWFTAAVLADCGLYPGRLVMDCWLDMEDADGYKARHGVTSSAAVTLLCQSYIEEMHRLGYPCGLYASYDWLAHRIDTGQLEKNFPYLSYWCAQWGARCDFTKASLWQYSDHLEIDGAVFDGNRIIRKNWEIE